MNLSSWCILLAAQMARIEEQQMAIHNLKSNIMEDLTDKGVLSGSDCQKVIELHQQVGNVACILPLSQQGHRRHSYQHHGPFSVFCSE